MADTDADNTRDAQPKDVKPRPSDSRSLLSAMGEKLSRLVREIRGEDSMRESIEEVIEESEREADQLSPAERMMLGNLLKFGELKVGDVMVPRAEIVAVDIDTSLPDLVKLFCEAQHSRLPLYRETLDDPQGMIHVKDVLSLVEIGANGTMTWRDGVSIGQLKRDILFVPAAMRGLDLLLKMQATRIHLALVIDEYGGTDGLVSIEDLVEEIVGDIDDEYDVGDEMDIVTRSDGSIDADARLDLDDFHNRTGIDLAPAIAEEDIDSLGGLVSSALGRVPVRGEIVHVHNHELEILEADPRRVKRLRIRPQRSTMAAARE